MTQKPNTRAFLFDDISDSSKHAFKRKAVYKLRLPYVLKRICGSDLLNV
ncbi:hypothetical protein [Methanimicrococcus blatticola]|uniref:Uncharacterized protein n=1 Tax=Methanimicrococcus blatticola TaxID=91560 RepID=A0A484F4Q5_9EURY|nr:hypothetical protein [Methanimicrococcus blatticola]MBZ3936168.1 hypothetical protein [Methanimicrococcus blatticola]MCC2508411.1 hypothetical protein [Methanimicrococcus blatticola]TDQ70136.1 hypothetical protein C7391_0475 [Methanimicrococcus blatticola]